MIRQRNLTGTGVEIFLQEEQSSGTETTHSAKNVGILALGETVRSQLELGELVQAQGAPGTWHSATFSKSYINPVVVFGPSTRTMRSPSASESAM